MQHTQKLKLSTIVVLLQISTAISIQIWPKCSPIDPKLQNYLLSNDINEIKHTQLVSTSKFWVQLKPTPTSKVRQWWVQANLRPKFFLSYNFQVGQIPRFNFVEIRTLKAFQNFGFEIGNVKNKNLVQKWSLFCWNFLK